MGVQHSVLSPDAAANSLKRKFECISTETQHEQEEDKCYLMRIPGELRNDIYRLCLVSDSRITIDQTGYSRSGLLRTSKAIRREALKIYYYENKFHIRMRSFDSDLLYKWNQHLTGLQLSSSRVGVSFSGNVRSTPNWTNLLTWLRRVFEGHIIQRLYEPVLLQKQGPRKLIRYVLGGMFASVWELRGKVSWEVMEKMLLAQRPVLEKIDGAWRA